MSQTEISIRLADLGVRVRALEDFMLDGFADVRNKRDIYRTALEAIRSGAVRAGESGEGEACDCARLAAEVLDG